MYTHFCAHTQAATLLKPFINVRNSGKKGYMKRIMVLVVIFSILSGCAQHVPFDVVSKLDQVGFLYGLWHGTILPVAWFISLFDDSVAIYAIYNNGGWYDFGFILGAAGVLGGGASLS